MRNEPAAQFEFRFLPIVGAEFGTMVLPPFRNAAVANEVAAMEQRAGIGVAVIDAAPGARRDAEESETGFQMLQISFELIKPGFIQPGFIQPLVLELRVVGQVYILPLPIIRCFRGAVIASARRLHQVILGDRRE